MRPVELALREGQHIKELDAAGECLGGAREALETSRACEYVTARSVTAVEFRLDRLEECGNSLVFVDTYRCRSVHEVCGRSLDQLGLGAVVKVDDLYAVEFRYLPKDGRLSYGPRSLER